MVNIVNTYLQETKTNSHTPEKTEVAGEKTWDDANDQDGKRPESITVNLLADGKKVAEKKVTSRGYCVCKVASLGKVLPELFFDLFDKHFD